MIFNEGKIISTVIPALNRSKQSLEDAKRTVSSISIPSDFPCADSVRSLSNNISSIIAQENSIKDSINQSIGRFRNAEAKNRNIVSGLLGSTIKITGKSKGGARVTYSKTHNFKYTGQIDTGKSGDGYSGTYTNWHGKSFKPYSQADGSYSNSVYYAFGKDDSRYDGRRDNDYSPRIHAEGCGPTALAIALSGYEKTKNITPDDTSKKMSYTSADEIVRVAGEYGYSADCNYSPSSEDVNKAIDDGKVIVARVPASDFYPGGSHYVTVVDTNSDGQVYVINPDPASKAGWCDPKDITDLDGSFIIVLDEKKESIKAGG